MLDEVLVKQCSPTLAGLKTGNLFPVSYTTMEQMRTEIRDCNRRLLSKGLRLLPVRYGNGRALLYMYRPACLRRDLADKNAARLLTDMGYTVSSPDRCLAKLIRKINEAPEFPHEVGIFLGYPPEDVKGFIENHACGCKCVGCWKVYGNEEDAKRTFCRYKKCTHVYCEQWKKGKSIEQLAVAV